MCRDDILYDMYILEAILACGGADKLLKEEAKKRLEEIHVQINANVPQVKTPVAI
jgi:hypothetical protein